MEYVAVQDLGYRIVLNFRDPAVVIPIGSHLSENDPLEPDHRTHVVRVIDGPAAGAELHFICGRPYPDETPDPEAVCPAPWLRASNGGAAMGASEPLGPVTPLLADAEAPLATEWNATTPDDARGHWLTGSFVAGLVRSGEIDGRFHFDYFPSTSMVATWHDEGLALVALCDAGHGAAGPRQISVEAITVIFPSREAAEAFAARLGGWPDDAVMVEDNGAGLWLVTGAWR